MSDNNEKIIYTVLRKISNDRQFISSAFKNWASDQHQVPFDADDLVAYFETKVGFDANEKRNFRIAFYAINSRNQSALLNVPEVLTDKDSAANSKVPPLGGSTAEKQIELSPEERTFQVFIETLLEQSKHVDPDVDTDMVEHFQDTKMLKKMKLSESSSISLNRWLASDLNQAFQTDSMTNKEMKAVFHQVYISLCESLGPVKTDQVLNQSISKVEQMNTGFSVSSLI